MAKEGRVFLRGMSSEQYGLKEFREAQLAAPRVRTDDVVVDDANVGHSGDSKDSRTWWRIAPGDEPFLTQNLQVHFVEIPPGKSNHGHGHQNEAVFSILRGKGYEIHDDKKYPWEAGDLAVVHGDSVHRHFQRRRRDGEGARDQGEVDVDVLQPHRAGTERTGRERGAAR